jgi:hypothetical protein
MDGQGVRIQRLAGARDFCPLHNVQTGTGAHPATCAMDIGRIFPEGKAAEFEAEHTPLSVVNVNDV